MQNHAVRVALAALCALGSVSPAGAQTQASTSDLDMVSKPMLRQVQQTFNPAFFQGTIAGAPQGQQTGAAGSFGRISTFGPAALGPATGSVAGGQRTGPTEQATLLPGGGESARPDMSRAATSAPGEGGRADLSLDHLALVTVSNVAVPPGAQAGHDVSDLARQAVNNHDLEPARGVKVDNGRVVLGPARPGTSDTESSMSSEARDEAARKKRMADSARASTPRTDVRPAAAGVSRRESIGVGRIGGTAAGGGRLGITRGAGGRMGIARGPGSTL